MIAESEFADIYEELLRRPLPVNMYRLKAGQGQSQSFGIVNRRSLPPDYSRQCWKRPELYKLLLEFGEKHVPFPFNAITVNINYQTLPHYDKHNVGDSYLVAFGEYTGGELEVFEGKLKGIHDINRKPVIEDFSKVLHGTRPFEGWRMSLVYYTIACDVPPPSVRKVGDQWVFFRGDVPCSGLPHPLYGNQNGVRQKRIHA